MEVNGGGVLDDGKRSESFDENTYEKSEQFGVLEDVDLNSPKDPYDDDDDMDEERDDRLFSLEDQSEQSLLGPGFETNEGAQMYDSEGPILVRGEHQQKQMDAKDVENLFATTLEKSKMKQVVSDFQLTKKDNERFLKIYEFLCGENMLVTKSQLQPVWRTCDLSSQDMENIWHFTSGDGETIDPHSFAVALRLIALAQNGHTVSLEKLVDTKDEDYGLPDIDIGLPALREAIKRQHKVDHRAQKRSGEDYTQKYGKNKQANTIHYSSFQEMGRGEGTNDVSEDSGIISSSEKEKVCPSCRTSALLHFPKCKECDYEWPDSQIGARPPTKADLHHLRDPDDYADPMPCKTCIVS